MLQTQIEKQFDSRINSAPPDFDAKQKLPSELYDFMGSLHREFTPRQQDLVKRRREVLEGSHRGNLPEHLLNSEAQRGDWKIELPDYIHDQHNQMTGPADDGELVVKMLNSGAPGVI